MKLDHKKNTFVIGAGFLCFGTFLGGWSIATGQILIVLVGLFDLTVNVIRRIRSKSGTKPENESVSRFFQPASEFSVSLKLFLVLLGIYLCSTLFVVDVSEDKGTLIKKLRNLMIPIGFLVLAPCFGVWKPYWKATLRVSLLSLSASIILASVSGLIGHFSGYNPLIQDLQPYPGRNGGVYSMVMTYAYGLGIALPALFSVVLNRVLMERLFPRRWYIWGTGIIWLALAIGVIGLYFSYTRGGALSLIAGVTFVLVCRRQWKLLAGLVFGVSIFIAISLIEKSRYTEVEKPTEWKTTSHTERYAQWKTAVGLFSENPIFGVGYRQFEAHCVDYKIRHEFPRDRITIIDHTPHLTWFGSHAHSNFLEHFATTGIVGGLCFFAFVVAWVREAAGVVEYRHIFLPPLISFIVGGILENTFFDSEVLTIVMLIYLSLQVHRMNSEKAC